MKRCAEVLVAEIFCSWLGLECFNSTLGGHDANASVIKIIGLIFLALGLKPFTNKSSSTAKNKAQNIISAASVL
jgi:hypothetical protein